MDSNSIWQVHSWAPMTHCVNGGSLSLRGKGRFGVKPSAKRKHAVVNCCCHLARACLDQHLIAIRSLAICGDHLRSRTSCTVLHATRRGAWRTAVAASLHQQPVVRCGGDTGDMLPLVCLNWSAADVRLLVTRRR